MPNDRIQLFSINSTGGTAAPHDEQYIFHLREAVPIRGIVEFIQSVDYTYSSSG